MKKIDYAIIFCGGKGTRLDSIGKRLNKSMLMINNNPIIYYVVSILIKSNVNKIIFPLGYKGNTIEKYIKNKFSKEINRFLFIKTGVDSNLSERIEIVKKNLKSNKTMILLNGDTLINFNPNIILHKYKLASQKPIACVFSKKIDLGFFLKKNKSLIFTKNVFINKYIQDLFLLKKSLDTK